MLAESTFDSISPSGGYSPGLNNGSSGAGLASLYTPQTNNLVQRTKDTSFGSYTPFGVENINPEYNFGSDISTGFTQQQVQPQTNGTDFAYSPLANTSTTGQQTNNQWFNPNVANWSNTYTPDKVYGNSDLALQLFKPEVMKYLGTLGFDESKMAGNQYSYGANGELIPFQEYTGNQTDMDAYSKWAQSIAGVKGSDYLNDFLTKNNLGVRYGTQGEYGINQLYNTKDNSVLAADVNQDKENFMQKNGWMIPLAALGGIAAGGAAMGASTGAIGTGSTAAEIAGVGGLGASSGSVAGAGLGGLYGSSAGAGTGELGSFTMPQGTNLSPLTGETLSGTGTALNAAPNLSLPGSQFWSMNNPIIKAGLSGALKGGVTSGLSGGNPLQGALVGGLSGGLGESLSGAGIGSSGINSSLIGAGVGALLGNKTNNDLSGQITNLQQLFSPNSAYATQLQQELDRKDAAAGRRSQYGPRQVELQARLAQLAAGQAPLLNTLYGQQAGNRNLMASTLMNNQAVSSGLNNLWNYLNGSNGSYQSGGALDPNSGWNWDSSGDFKFTPTGTGSEYNFGDW